MTLAGRTVLALAVAAGLFACIGRRPPSGEGDGGLEDGGGDGAADAGSDAASDATGDAGSDAASDATGDAGSDAAGDAAPDANDGGDAGDAGSDAAGDAGSDAAGDAGDAGSDATGDAGTDGGAATREFGDAVCNNGISDDGDAFTDCADFDCLLHPDVTVCGAPPATTVSCYDLQKEPPTSNHPTPNTSTVPGSGRITLSTAVVTSPIFVWSNEPSFFVSDPLTDAAPWTGVFVYARDLDTLAVVPGDRVTVKGYYAEFLAVTEVVALEVATVGTASVPAPAAVSYAELQPSLAEPWEGVLVRITEPATVSSVNPSGSFDVISGGSDPLHIGNSMAHNTSVLVGDTIAEVTGLVHYGTGAYRVEPRGPADVAVAGGADGGTDGGEDGGSPDLDGDGIPDASDNCPDVSNLDQADDDQDAFGDACDLCPWAYDPAQTDTDGNGRGDACPDTATHLVISEISTAGTGGFNDEFVELYNPTGRSVDLSTWSLQYKSSSGTFQKKNLTGTVVARGFFLIAHTPEYSGTPAADFSNTSFSMSATAATLGLLDHQNAVTSFAGAVDFAGWGTGSQVEGTPASAPPSGGSLERRSGASTSADLLGNGYDSDDAANDFVLRTAREPQSTASAKEP